MCRDLGEVGITFREVTKMGIRLGKTALSYLLLSWKVGVVLSARADIIFRRGNHRYQNRNVCEVKA